MIPLRVKLENFLCHQELEISFEGGALWLLHGGNGTGKSTIFDGITFALFGGHRAGEIDADELIRKGCDKARVEFEFLLQGRRYRAQRTVQRRKGSPLVTTLLLRQREEPDEGEEKPWVPVDETGQVRGFERWIAQHTGLKFRTFISSVVLQQDQAGRLLDARAKERFDLLASLVDLDRYRQLHELVERKRGRLATRAQAQRDQLLGLPLWTPEALDEEAAALLAERAVEGSRQSAVDLRRDLLHAAQEWQRTEEERQRCQGELERARALLLGEPRVLRDHQRLVELEQVLPTLERGIRAREELRLLQGSRAALSARILEGEAELLAAAAEVQAREEALRELREETARIHRAREQEQRSLQELAEPLTQLRLYRALHQQVVELEGRLAALPAGLLARLEQEQGEEQELAAWERACPLLRVILRAREESGAARQRETAAATRAQVARALVAERALLLATLEPAEEEAAAQEQAAALEERGAKTALQQEQAALAGLAELRGKPHCDRCGQALHADQLLAERARREAAVARAGAEVEEAGRRAEATLAAARELKSRLRAVVGERDRALTSAREEESARTLAQELAQQGEDRVAHALAELPPAQAALALTMQAQELAAVEQRVGALPGVRLRLRETGRLVEQVLRPLTIALEAARQALAVQGEKLPSDHAALASTAGAAESRLAALARDLEGCQAREADVSEQVRGAAAGRAALARRLEEVRRESAVLMLEEHACRATLDTLRHTMPVGWQALLDQAEPESLVAWQSERMILLRAGAREGLELLQRAKHDQEVLLAALAALAPVQAAIPDEARGAPQQMADLLADAEAELKAARLSLSTREAMLILHRQQREARQQVDEELRQTEEACALHEGLALLLGRKGLQLQLLQRAERQIVDFANIHLERLSSGQLRLRLRKRASDGDEALELEAYNRMSGEQPVGVAFLSGSQRFRVAVSLALAIGQYASRQQRPLESVILDEGFGCLDGQGRQVMLQELQRLSGLLQRVLVVSHQEEFAEVFPHVYRFELVNGQTQVTRELR